MPPVVHPAVDRMRAAGIRSQRELARLAGTHHPILSNWLAGKRSLSKQVGRRVAALLGVPVETVLFDWSPEGLRARRPRRARRKVA